MDLEINRKSILIVRNYPSYMDVKNNTYNIQELGLAKAFVRKGYICDIVLWTDGNEETVRVPVEERHQNIHVYYKKGRTWLKNTVFLGCKELFEKYDIIQPVEYNQIQSWILAGKKTEKVRIFHGPYYSDFNKRYNLMCKMFDLFFLKRYKKKNTKFLVKSKMAEDFLVSKGILEDNISVCGVGIDINMLSNRTENNTQPIYLDMMEHKENLKILYVGRLEPRRNISFIFEVFRKVLDYKPHARLYMIGSGNSEFVKKMLNYADDLQIRNHIIWQEKIEQKYLSDVYSETDFFLLPTAYEIFGMVLLEAMYYGTVAITTYNGGSSTLINHGENGFIIDELDAEQWAKCVLNVENQRSEKEIIQNNAHDKIANEYLWDKLIGNFEKAYFE